MDNPMHLIFHYLFVFNFIKNLISLLLLKLIQTFPYFTYIKKEKLLMLSHKYLYSLNF